MQVFEDGCLIKTLAVRSLRFDDSVVPTLPELERFKAGLGAGADDELLQAMPAAGSGESFAPGDIVKVRAPPGLRHISAISPHICPTSPHTSPHQVRDGELRHVVGIVHSVNSESGSVIVVPTSSAGMRKDPALQRCAVTP